MYCLTFLYMVTLCRLSSFIPLEVAYNTKLHIMHISTHAYGYTDKPRAVFTIIVSQKLIIKYPIIKYHLVDRREVYCGG